MTSFDRKTHWENIYKTRPLHEVSWYQPSAGHSLYFIEELKVSKSAKIIDVGGGDSYLVDHLLNRGYENVTVLDISEAAIQRAKGRLGKKASLVNWIQADASTFTPDTKFDLWHDRAAFHFLTDEKDIQKYISNAEKGIASAGHLVIGTFSEDGPAKCSGIDIQQYSETALIECFKHSFSKIECLYVDHETPSEKVQNFIFCSFKKK